MELRVLEYFLAVAREQSISGAAEYLHLTQPTLSRGSSGSWRRSWAVPCWCGENEGQRTALTPEGRLFRQLGSGDPGPGLQGGTGGTAVGKGDHR